MKRIPLSQGLYAIVDDQDFDFLNQWKWNAYRNGNTYYARRRIPGTNKKITMHRQLVGANGILVDHVNGNGLDNRRSNLRQATRQQNGMNRKLQRNNKSGASGVNQTRYGSWSAALRLSGRNIYLGSYPTKRQAVLARKEAERKYFGEYSPSFSDRRSMKE